jgi:hypothetical protein
MWWTERGHQVMRGKEWELFAEGLGCLVDGVTGWVERSVAMGRPRGMRTFFRSLAIERPEVGEPSISKSQGRLFD